MSVLNYRMMPDIRFSESLLVSRLDPIQDCKILVQTSTNHVLFLLLPFDSIAQTLIKDFSKKSPGFIYTPSINMNHYTNSKQTLCPVCSNKTTHISMQ